MRLNTIKPHPDSTSDAKRRGRGIGSGLGKTGGRGHKGTKITFWWLPQSRFRRWSDATATSFTKSWF